MTKDEALKMALAVLELHNAQYPDRVKGYFLDVITAIKVALAQPEQEPVAWGMEQSDGEILDVISPEEHARLEGGYTVPLYRHPPQCTWVGLTNKERAGCWETIPELAMRKVEAKLKEKNT